MADPRNVQNCRWAEPTLFVPYPVWIASDDYPWSCRADGVPLPVEDTDMCSVCMRWQRCEHPRRFRDGAK